MTPLPHLRLGPITSVRAAALLARAADAEPTYAPTGRTLLGSDAPGRHRWRADASERGGLGSDAPGGRGWRAGASERADADADADADAGTELDADLDLDERRSLGAGAEVFDRAVAFLRALGPQRAIGGVWPEGAVARLGATVLVVPRFGPLRLTALDRVVAVVDEPGRWGYAYGTLPGHPECGEEAFVVTRAADGEVVMRVMARSRPAVPGGRWLVPAAVVVQRHVARRYLAATAAAVR